MNENSKCMFCNSTENLVENLNHPVCVQCYESRNIKERLTQREDGTFILKDASTEEALQINQHMNRENEALKEEIKRLRNLKPSPSGNAPLNPTSGGVSNIPKKGYGSYQGYV